MIVTVTDMLDSVTPEAIGVQVHVVEGGITGGGGGAVDSVNGQVGVVVLDAGDVGADASGAAVAAQVAAESTAAGALASHTAASDPHPGYLTAAEGNAAYDALGAASAAQAAAIAASQPLDSDLTAIAALSTTAFGRGLLASADAAALRSSVGLVLGTDVYSKAAVDAGFQPLDSDLTAIAALSTTSFGRSFLALADAAAGRTLLGLGTAATVNTGTSSGDVPLLSTGGRLPIARVASGTPDGTKFVRDDGTLAVPAGGGGTTILTGTTVPTSSDGAVGNFFLNTATKWLYGPKASTAAGVVDDFNRADGALTTPWTNRVGIIAVVSNQAAYSSGTAPAIATVDGTSDDYVTASIATTQADTGFVFRYVDSSNFWLVFRDSLYRCVAGSFAAQASWASTTSLTVQLSGSSIVVTNKATGAVLASLTDATHVSGTKHGLRLNGAGRIDDFRAEPPAWPIALKSA